MTEAICEEERVEKGHIDIGKYKIVVSSVLPEEKADVMAKNLNSMPSNTDMRMFRVFFVNSKRSWGYIVKRKVCVGDKISFIERRV